MSQFTPQLTISEGIKSPFKKHLMCKKNHRFVSNLGDGPRNQVPNEGFHLGIRHASTWEVLRWRKKKKMQVSMVGEVEKNSFNQRCHDEIFLPNSPKLFSVSDCFFFNLKISCVFSFFNALVFENGSFPIIAGIKKKNAKKIHGF